MVAPETLGRKCRRAPFGRCDWHTESQLDMVMLGREFLRDPYWPYHAAMELGSAASRDILPIQYARAVE